MVAIGVASVSVLCSQNGHATGRRLTYRLDPDRTVVAFTVEKGLLPALSGTAGHAHGVLKVDPDGRNMDLRVTVSLDGLTTRDRLATILLRGPGLLDTRHFPDVQFVSDNMTISRGTVRLDGELSLHGVTHPVVLSGGLPHVPPPGRPVAVELSGEIDRTDFGIGGLRSLAGRKVELTIHGWLSPEGAEPAPSSQATGAAP